MTDFVGYFRVSTDRQGRSGLGLEAQREAVTSFIAGRVYRDRERGGRMTALPFMGGAKIPNDGAILTEFFKGRDI